MEAIKIYRPVGSQGFSLQLKILKNDLKTRLLIRLHYSFFSVFFFCSIMNIKTNVKNKEEENNLRIFVFSSFL